MNNNHSIDNNIKRIGIMRSSALGDIIWCLPLVEELKKSFPQAEITFFVSSTFKDIFKMSSGIKTVSFKKPKGLKDYLKLKKFFQDLPTFDILICSQSSLRINLLYPFIKAKKKIGLHSNYSRDFHSFFVNEQLPFVKQHNLLNNLDFAKHITKNKKTHNISYDLKTCREDQEWVHKNLPNNYWVLHPVASNIDRSLSAKSYAHIIFQLSKEQSLPVVITGVKQDKFFINSILKSLAELEPKENTHSINAIDIAGKTSLTQLAATLEKATLLIAPDSGPIHLANALGTKTLGIYASLPVSFTGPFGQESNCLDYYFKKAKKPPNPKKAFKRNKGSGLMTVCDADEVVKKAISLLL